MTPPDPGTGTAPEPAFILRGTFRGRPAWASWSGPGRFRTEPTMMAWVVEDVVRDGVGLPITPTGPDVTPTLVEPLGAFATLRAAFDRGGELRVEGEVEGLAEAVRVPPGAIP